MSSQMIDLRKRWKQCVTCGQDFPSVTATQCRECQGREYKRMLSKKKGIKA